MRPAAEHHLADQSGLDPPRLAGKGYRHIVREGTVVALDRGEGRRQLAKGCLGESSADMADVLQSVAFIDAEEHRSERAAAAPLSRLPAADDDLDRLPEGDLDPVARAAAGQIARRQPLGDDAFKPLRARDLEQVLARDVAERRGDVDGRRERQTEILQPVSALDVGEADKRLTAFFE